MIRLLIAEDQAMIRGALAALVGREADIEVVAQVAGATPDVAFQDGTTTITTDQVQAAVSAIVAAHSSPGPGPSAATAGRPRAINARPAARALSTVTASIFATISSSGMGRPQLMI